MRKILSNCKKGLSMFKELKIITLTAAVASVMLVTGCGMERYHNTKSLDGDYGNSDVQGLDYGHEEDFNRDRQGYGEGIFN